MQMSLTGFIGLILASGGFCTALVVGGVYIGSFNAKFVSKTDCNHQGEVIITKLDEMHKNFDELKLELTKHQTIENMKRIANESKNC